MHVSSTIIITTDCAILLFPEGWYATLRLESELFVLCIFMIRMTSLRRLRAYFVASSRVKRYPGSC